MLGPLKQRTQRDGPQLWYRVFAVGSLLDNVVGSRHDIIIPASEDLEGYNHRFLIINCIIRLSLYLFEPTILPLDTVSFLPLHHTDFSHIEEGGVLLYR